MFQIIALMDKGNRVIKEGLEAHNRSKKYQKASIKKIAITKRYDINRKHLYTENEIYFFDHKRYW